MCFPDTEKCWKCPDNQWPNKWKDKCLPRMISYLTYEEILGVSLSSVAAFFSLVSFFTLTTFIHYQNTSVVKSNNRNLSFLILVSLTVTFLSCLVFIGLPGRFTCIVRQPLFGITFTVCVSSIQAKTIIVFLAFHATKPGSPLRRYLGKKLPSSIVAICSSIQSLICMTWIGISPPYPFKDFYSEPGQIIIECQEGLGLYFMLGFIGLLAKGSFIIAFLARNLPDLYNEARLITFSMLIFFSIWISFIPTYMSTKGKYMAAVEIFAILFSGGGILLCMFFPKCYILLCKPERKRKTCITHSHPVKTIQYNLQK
ncbi:vomeronasal type-2 receptor 26-like [Bombina bombina]|uniref:vomeronasal type-2 receptor 26-like n=1 Tax=Bombina bombina TaxID=8345 RepID=UPI00235A824D|nr:vomeronasal type-2 receptor 26-like [Bombina bombina]